MPPDQSKGSELLRREILDQAAREREIILRQAKEAADGLVSHAAQEAEQARQEKLTATLAEAKRRQEAILATVAVEAGRKHAAQVESVLQSIHDQARDRLRRGEGFDRREALVALTVEALSRMNGSDFCMRLSGADLRVLGNGLAEAVRHRWARPWLNLEVGEDPEARECDWILQDEEGRQIWDLGLEARLERLWPDLRRQIAGQAGLVAKEEAKPGVL